MEVRLVDPDDDIELQEWTAVLQASDTDLWPDLIGFTLPDIRAFARHRGRSKRYDLLAARAEPSGPILGVAMMELPLRDNVRSAEVTVAVHPERRRRGVGTAVVEAMAVRGRSDGREVLNSIVDVPVARAADHAALAFAPKLGFEATLAGNVRHLCVPMDADRTEDLRGVVAGARDAGDYRVLTFEGAWPADYLGDRCALYKSMSTDEPHGDDGHEEEIWDAERLGEVDALRVARPRPHTHRGGTTSPVGPARRVHGALHRGRLPGPGLADADRGRSPAPGPSPRPGRQTGQSRAARRPRPEARLIVTGNAAVERADDRRQRDDGVRGRRPGQFLAEAFGPPPERHRPGFRRFL